MNRGLLQSLHRELDAIIFLNQIIFDNRGQIGLGVLHARYAFSESWVAESQNLGAVRFSRKRNSMKEPDDPVGTITTVDLHRIARMRVLRDSNFFVQ